MLRGEFIRGDGLVTPNNLTLYGAGKLLEAALQNDALSLYMGLCTAVPAYGLRQQDIVEPTIGVNGYARQALAQDSTDWPTTGSLNNEAYIESKVLTFAASGGNFSSTFTRLFLGFSLDALTGDIFSLGSALPAPLLITPTTLLADRQYKYRLYLR
jgi:hypothetical protein